MTRLLVCPNCGSDNLQTVETTTIYYPAEFTREADGSVAMDYPGDESYDVNDEGSEYDGRIFCRSCIRHFNESELADPEEV